MSIRSMTRHTSSNRPSLDPKISNVTYERRTGLFLALPYKKKKYRYDSSSVFVYPIIL